MKTQKTNETDFLRIINKEMMENNLDPVCYDEAQRRSSRGINATMICYVELRLKALKAVGGGMAVAKSESSSIMSTQQCHKRISSRTGHRYNKSSLETARKSAKVELWVSILVLFIGSISTALCLWCFTGESFSQLPYTPLLIIVAVIQLIPWLMKKSNLCSQLNATSALCIIMACISCGAGVKLLKSNPSQKAPAESQVKELVNTIMIVPAASEISEAQNTVVLYNN